MYWNEGKRIVEILCIQRPTVEGSFFLCFHVITVPIYIKTFKLKDHIESEETCIQLKRSQTFRESRRIDNLGKLKSWTDAMQL